MAPQLLQLLIGIALLMAGGELLVRGSVALARKLGISVSVIGLTVVAYGTSAPELIVSMQAAAAGSPDIALGNIIGSNISNILLILGITACIIPLAVLRDTVRRDGWLMVAVTLLFMLLCLDGQLGRVDALLLLAALVLYSWHACQGIKARPVLPAREFPQQKECGFCAIACIVLGLGLLVTGADILVDGASMLARRFGVSEAVIGLTIVAIGTSLPELVTSLTAAWRREAELCVANLIGSNIFNILGVGGLSVLITPIAIAPEIMAFDLYAMLAVAALGVFLLRTGHRLSRREGIALVALYVSYGVYQYAFSN